MSEPAHSSTDRLVVAAQLCRAPREPWRVAVRCRYGFPSVIASPSRLDDGTPFPTLYWLTCPWVAEGAASEESAGATSRWAERAATDPALAAGLHAADAALREARARETGGDDPCATVGIGGQRDPLGVKCLHVHAAAYLAGIDDPVGCAVVGNTGDACPDERCARFVADEERS